MIRGTSTLLSLGLLALLAGCGGGGSKSKPATSTPDTTPAGFTFTSQADQAPSSTVTSNEITISGITANAPISITGGEYSIESGSYTSAAGTVANNQRIRVRATVSAQFSTATNVVVTVGGVSATFTVTTVAADTTPAPFQFAYGVNAARNDWISSGNVTITGINTSTPVSIENGEYSIAGGAFTSAAGAITNGQAVVVRVRASADWSRVTRARLTVGDVTSAFEATAVLPVYVPDSIAHDGDGIVYLLSNANRLVFRWSIPESRYIDPFSLAAGTATPARMAFSPAHQRLYFGYYSGAITQMDVTAAAPAEVAFATAADSINALGSAGNFLVVQAGFNYDSGYIYNGSGAVVDQGGYYYGYSAETAWDAVNSRLYYTRDGISPDDLHYDVIDQATGAVTSTGETPYHGDYSIQAPIRISSNGQYVLLGSGDIYSQPDLRWSGSVAGSVIDARWFADGSLLTLRTVNNQTTLRRLSSTNLSVLEQRTYAGHALRVVGSDTAMAVLVNNAGNLQIHSYVPDDDTDDDGVSNAQDAFPLDVAASVDTDRDGFPDAWNTGRSAADSTTGLTADAFPQDAACWLTAHGAGGACDYGAAVPNYLPDQVVQNGDIVYLLSSANRRVYRWSISAGNYVNPYVVGVERGFTTDAPAVIAHVAAHQRLYLGYESGSIRYIDLTAGSPVETHFANEAYGVTGLASAGNYLAVRSGAYYGGGHVYDASGAVTAQGGSYNGYSTEATWDPVNSRLYYTRDNTSPNDLHYDAIAQSTGAITASAETPYHGDYSIATPIRVSANGQYILLGSGDLYRHTDLNWAGSVSTFLADARWLANGDLVTLTSLANQTTLRRLAGAAFEAQELHRYTGTPLRVVGSDTSMVVLVMNNGTLNFHRYLPSADGDADGVPYPQDAFPLDVAASADTDGDDYPDAWNPGRGPADSSSGLLLDAFPQDAECWLPAHGSGGACNYGATMPAYVPDRVAADGGIIYLLSRDNRRVYRWSTTSDAYLKPWTVGVTEGLLTTAPVNMAFSSAQQRLYLGYGNGAIRYLAPAAGAANEIPFLTLQSPVEELTTLGSHLLAVAGSSYVINVTGGIVTEGWGGISRDYAFDAVHSRLYQFSDCCVPNDLHYRVINPATGQIGASAETPYHGAYIYAPPILVSPDGARILLGSGDFYGQADLTWAGNLGAQFVGGRWLANGDVVTLGGTGGTAMLRRLSNSFAPLEWQTYPGEAFRLVGTDAEMTAIVIDQGSPRFYDYVPNDDVDGDGVANVSDAFPTDLAASVDTDHDGHPDAWNAGRGQADSTTGLALDAFALDSACWLAVHGAGGVCNPGSTIPQYVPDEVESHGDTVYLLSAANRRVYRWSIATGSYLNPYVLGAGGASPAPQMAYSSAHQRLYLGYDTGAIRYFDANASNPVEAPFASTAKAVYGLGAVGNFLLAIDESGAWATHYVFNNAGVITDSAEWNYLSRDITWDPAHSRVYFFRNWVSPTDLHYEVIDQVTGEISAAGETPYHGDISSQGPIRVSPDGERILLGSGALLDRATLTFAGGLDPITDAQWRDNIIVTLDWYDGVRIRDAQTHAELQFYQYNGAPRALVFGSAEAYLVHIDNGATAFVRLPFFDQDADGLPLWWEDLHGLDDANAGDGAADLDSDGVSNLLEYQNGANPQTADTDGDGLTDAQEIVTFATSPANADSDGEGLDDHAEVITHLTDPWDRDSDNDSYTDLDEVLYGGNPNNVASLPQPISGYTQGFEGTPNLVAWAMPVGSLAPWSIDTSVHRTGLASFRSGAVDHYQYSGTRYRAVFPAGQLSYYARVMSDSGGDRLELLVDGVQQVSTYGDTEWVQVVVPITPGLHEIEWRYQKDSYAAWSAADAAWVDDVVFTAQ